MRIAFGILLGTMVGGMAAAQSDLRPMPRPDSDETAAEAAPIVLAEASVAPESTPEREAVVVVMSSKSPVPRPQSLLSGQEFRLALLAASKGDWGRAESLAEAHGQVAADVVEWKRLRDGVGSFADYRAFLDRNGDWPGLALLRRRGERAIGSGADADAVIAYFADNVPQTGRGARRLAAAYQAKGAKVRAEEVLVAAWTGLDMSESEEQRYLDAHGSLLKPHHAARLDFLLWERELNSATRMLARVDSGHAALGKARIALQRRAGNVDTLIAAVPKTLVGHPGLAHDRMDWQIAKRRRDSAADMILTASTSADTLGRPEAWAKRRATLARQAMRNGNAKRAYALASKHRIDGGSAYADLEWLSGYLALTYLDNPEQALEHFKSFRGEIYTPISLGRAFYWQGRALEAMGDAEAAKAAYAEGARNQTSFYGLLAAEKAGLPMDPALTGLTDEGDWRTAKFTGTSVFQAADLFFLAGQSWETARFLRHLAESLEGQEHIKLADYTLSLGDPHLAVRVGKQAARAGTVALRAYYPLRPLGADELPVPEALALSIARRESEFHSAAVSHAGARGLMQLMPGTAKQMALSLGIPYSLARLTSDPSYNIQLGSAYLKHLIDQFGENIVLVSVGYNAGPHRARSWMKTYGDPRDPSVDVVDWIEHIPFDETRNYVMRVAESLPVYRARLSGKVEPLLLTQELKAR